MYACLLLQNRIIFLLHRTFSVFGSLRILLCFFLQRGVFVYNTDVSKTHLKHESIQKNMELVLLCISIAAIVLALVLLTVLR